MSIPDARLYNPDPEYLRLLIQRAGVSQVRAAKIVGVDPRTMRRYLADREPPYAVQFALECLAAYKPRGRRKGVQPNPVE